MQIVFAPTYVMLYHFDASSFMSENNHRGNWTDILKHIFMIKNIYIAWYLESPLTDWASK